MTNYEINLNDGSTDTVEAKDYHLHEGWVIFTGERLEILNGYPAARVDRIVAAEEPKVTEPRIVFEYASLDKAELAKTAERVVKDYARWAAL